MDSQTVAHLVSRIPTMLSKLRHYTQSFLYPKRLAIRLLRWTLTLGVLVISIWFIAKKVYSEYIIISASHINPDVPKLLISWLCITVSTLLGAWEWTLLIKVLGGYVKPIAGMRIHLISALSKYIPGYVWPYLSKSHLAVRYGVPFDVAIFSVAGELAIIYLSGILLLLLSLPFNDLTGEVKGISAGIGFMAGCIIIAFVVGSLSDNHCSKFVKSIREVWKGLIFVIIAVTLTWCLLGLGFYMLDASIKPPTDNPWRLFGGLIMALLGGQLALFVPMGIGVREAILVAILNTDKQAWLVVLMALIFRLEMTLGEIISTLLVVTWSVAAKWFRNTSKG